LQVFGAAPVHKDSALYALKEAGKRMAGTLNLHLAAGVTRGFAAFRLTDGTSDGTVYDCRADAIRHQLHETLCWYESLRPRSFGADECALTLAYARAAYDAGWRNPADAPAPIKPVRLEDFVAKTRQLRRHARSH
jgi:hypothetical protein